MEISIESIVQNLEPPPELTADLIGQIDPKSGKTLIEIAVILGRGKYIEKLIKIKSGIQ